MTFGLLQFKRVLLSSGSLQVDFIELYYLTAVNVELSYWSACCRAYLAAFAPGHQPQQMPHALHENVRDEHPFVDIPTVAYTFLCASSTMGATFATHLDAHSNNFY